MLRASTNFERNVHQQVNDGKWFASPATTATHGAYQQLAAVPGAFCQQAAKQRATQSSSSHNRTTTCVRYLSFRDEVRKLRVNDVDTRWTFSIILIYQGRHCNDIKQTRESQQPACSRVWPGGSHAIYYLLNWIILTPAVLNEITNYSPEKATGCWGSSEVKQDLCSLFNLLV